jgi:hypothetical protein
VKRSNPDAIVYVIMSFAAVILFAIIVALALLSA